jgi:hypothetical protein
MNRAIRRQSLDEPCLHGVGVLGLLFALIGLGLVIGAFVWQGNTSNQVGAQQMQITSLQMQVLELAMAQGGANVTRVLRQSGTFQWAGLTSPIFCQPTTANYSVYDITVGNVLTFALLEFEPASLSLSLANCPNDGNSINIVFTNFDNPVPPEVQYLSYPSTTVPMTPAIAALYTAQCAASECVVGPVANVPFNGYKGYNDMVAGNNNPTFGFQYTAATGTILPLNFNPGRTIPILLLNS